MAGNRRDLTIGIDGDPKGFDTACRESETSARGLDRELQQLERKQAAQEKVTARTAAVIRKYAGDMTGASLAAKKMGDEAERAANKAEKAQIRADAAAKAYERGLIDESLAAHRAAQAQDALERAAVKAAEAQLAASRAAEKQAAADRKLADDSARADAKVTKMQGGLVSLIAAGAGLAPPIAAAGVALGLFAAVGAPAVLKVVKAQQDLSASWGTLDGQQKVAAAGLAGVITAYKRLANDAQPTTLIAFNRAMEVSRQLLPKLGATFTATSRGASDFLTQIEDFATGPSVDHFLGFVQSNATPALHDLGQTFTQTGTLALNLVQDLAPMGFTLLHSANGVLGLVNALERVDPRLAEMAVAAVALRGPVTGLTGFVEKLQGKFSSTAEASKVAAGGLSTLAVESSGLGGKVGSSAAAAERAAAKVGKLGKESRLAAAGTKLLNVVTGAGPGIYVAAAVGLVYLAARMSNMRTATDGLIDKLRGQYQAFGNNIQGYRAYGNALKGFLDQQRAAYNAIKQTVPTGPEGFRASNPGGILPQPEALQKLETAYKSAQQAQTNITQGATELGKEFGLTTASGVDLSKSMQLATAAGVDLSKGVLKSGQLTADARAKITQYEAAVAQAADPTKRIADDMSQVGNQGLLMQDRIKALTDALSAYVKPALDAWNASTQLKQGYSDLAKALNKAKGDYSGTSDASRQLRTQLANQITLVSNLYTATLQQTGSQAKARAETARNLPILYAMAGNSKDARAQVDALAKTLVGAASAGNITRTSFLATAKQMGLTRAQADQLWAAYKRLPANVRTNVTTNVNAALTRIQAVRSALKALQDKTITITAYYRAVDVANRTSQANRGDARGGNAHGGPIGYAHGGSVARMAGGGPSGPVVGPGSGTSDDIPVWLSAGEYVIKASQAKKHMALLDSINGAKNGFATGGVADSPTGSAAFAPVPTTTVDVGSLLSQWQQAVQPATKAQVDAAAKARRTQVDQLASARGALRRAEAQPTRTHAERIRRAEAIAAAERKIAKERRDLADATTKLNGVERRYQAGRQTPAQQFGSALALGIKNTGAFIHNLEVLADRGFGQLAQQLLSTGGPEAEKIAASAVKMTNKQLSGLQAQVKGAQAQQETLTHLPQILALKSAIKGGASTWDSLLTATGLTPNDLAATLKLMSAELSKTSTGRALLDQLKARGYAEGGPIVGPAGVDRVPLWGTAGEYVVKAGPAAANRSYLDAINRGSAVHAPAALPVRGGDGASVLAPITIHAPEGRSALAVAKETSYELGWALKMGGSR